MSTRILFRTSAGSPSAGEAGKASSVDDFIAGSHQTTICYEAFTFAKTTSTTFVDVLRIRN
jgi:hypothetical protein